MATKRLSILLTMMAFLSVCFFVRPALADSSSAVKTIAIQTSQNFLGKDNPPTRIDTTNVVIYAFTTNGGEGQTKPAPEKINLTLTLTNSLGQATVWEQQLVISAGATFGEIPVQFPAEGQWTISAEGTINGTPLSAINISTNTNIVYVGTPQKLSVSPLVASISVNKTQQYSAKLKYVDNSVYDATNEVLWTTSSSGIASIDMKGLAKGLHTGVVTINAYDPVSKLSQNALLFVTPDIMDVVLTTSPTVSKIGVGATQQFQATTSVYILGSLIGSTDVTSLVAWTSSTPEIASIGSLASPSGQAQGLSPGITEITATLPLLNTATSSLEVEGLKLTPLSSTIFSGDTLQYTLTLINPDLTEQDVTNSAQWTSSLQTVASINNEKTKGLATALAAGSVAIAASYLTPANNEMSLSATLNVQNQQTLDHFGFVSTPSLKLRYDVDPANAYQSTWSYLGEPMLLNVYLQAYTKAGAPIKDYVWDTTWFGSAANWEISCFDPLKLVNPSYFRYSILSSPSIDGNSILHVQFVINQDDAIREKVIRNIRLTVKPKDRPDVTPLAPMQAVVLNQGTTFTLYGGQIRVAQGYFYLAAGNAQVYVEKYDDSQSKFVQNQDDSQTSVSTWDLSGTAVSTPDFKFSAGNGEVSVHSDTSNVTKTLTPTGIPSYLNPVSGTLTWGQIVDNPPPQNPLLQVAKSPLHP